MSDSIKVAVRCRPFNDREKQAKSKCIVEMNGPTTTLNDPDGTNKPAKYTFDYSYWSHDSNDSHFANNETVFNDLGVSVLDNAFQGYNASLFAYGQTGSGKSYSMVGYGSDLGIIPKVCDLIFKRIESESTEETTYNVECSMIEIYNEEIRDLLNPSKNPPHGLKIRDHPKTGPYVEDLTPVLSRSYQDISALMDKGTAARTVASTNMNKTSSRAHTIFQIIFTQATTNAQTGKTTNKVSKINLVDLAGSEKLSTTGATGDRMKEGININLSLTNLGNCISALSERAKNPKIFVPYRTSVLTHLLKESLGGNSKTIMIAAISPASINYQESLSTLRYADRAKRIQTKAIINEDPNVKLIKELQAEIENLKQQLSGKVPIEPNIEDQPSTNEEVQEMLDQSQKLIQELLMSNEEKQQRAATLEAERNLVLKRYGLLARNRDTPFDRLKHIHIVNLNEDPQMTDRLTYPLMGEITTVGAAREDVSTEIDSVIPLSGDGIAANHAKFIIVNYDHYKNQPDNTGVEVYVEPVSEETHVYINGQLITGRSQVLHSDRIVFGMHHFFRLVLPDPSNLLDTPKQIDWKFAVEELADKFAEEKTQKNDEEQALRLREHLEQLLDERKKRKEQRRIRREQGETVLSEDEDEEDFEGILKVLSEKTPNQMIKLRPSTNQANSIAIQTDPEPRNANNSSVCHIL